MAQLTEISPEVGEAWVRSVANALFWQDGTYSTMGAIGEEWGDPGWMKRRSGGLVDAFHERARAFVPEEVWAAYERYW